MAVGCEAGSGMFNSIRIYKFEFYPYNCLKAGCEIVRNHLHNITGFSTSFQKSRTVAKV